MLTTTTTPRSLTRDEAADVDALLAALADFACGAPGSTRLKHLDGSPLHVSDRRELERRVTQLEETLERILREYCPLADTV